MVVSHHIHRILEPPRATDDVQAVGNVLFHDGVFPVVQPAGLQENRVSHPDFAHIMQKGALDQALDSGVVERQ